MKHKSTLASPFLSRNNILQHISNIPRTYQNLYSEEQLKLEGSDGVGKNGDEDNCKITLSPEHTHSMKRVTCI